MKPRYGRREVDNSLEPGQDSFLDVVANLVGILIILVVLIGSQAKSVWEKLRTDEEVPNAEMAALETEIEKRDLETTKLKSENVQIESMIKAQKNAAKILTSDRDRLQLAVSAVRQSIEARQSELSQSEQENLSLISQGELRSIQPEVPRLQDAPVLPNVIMRSLAVRSFPLVLRWVLQLRVLL